jgi:hypothetical protein
MTYVIEILEFITIYTELRFQREEAGAMAGLWFRDIQTRPQRCWTGLVLRGGVSTVSPTHRGRLLCLEAQAAPQWATTHRLPGNPYAD